MLCLQFWVAFFYNSKSELFISAQNDLFEATTNTNSDLLGTSHLESGKGIRIKKKVFNKQDLEYQGWEF